MWMAVYGDLRFASHHDMMRVVERTLLRANIPLRYTQGFSPRVILSLSFPRPVGVATKKDLLVLSLDSPMLRQDLLTASNQHCPEGLKFVDAVCLKTKETPTAVECTYEIRVPHDKTGDVTQALENFSTRDSFPLQRTKPPKRRTHREPTIRTIDLKLMIDSVEFDGEMLTWRQIPHQTLWARPNEAMEALGLDPEGNMASLTRTSLTFKGLDQCSGSDSDPCDEPKNNTTCLTESE
jgi:radical SAM-linked protein